MFHSPPGEWQQAQAYALKLQQAGVAGVLGFVVVTALATSVGLPRQLFAFVAGFAYGTAIGVLLSSVAAVIGCAITFFVANKWLSAFVRKRYPAIVRWLDAALKQDAFLKIIILRLQPLGTNLLTNVCAGVSHVSARLFFASSWLGYLPQMLIFALLGTGLRINSSTHLLISLVLTGVSFILGAIVYRRYRLNIPIK